MDQEDRLILEELNNNLALTYANFRCVVQNRHRFEEMFKGIFSIEEAYLLMEGVERLLLALAERRRECDKAFGREN